MLAEEVEGSYPGRIESEGRRDQVHLRFVSERDLHRPEPAKGAVWHVVREHPSRPDADVVAAVRAHRGHGTCEQHPGAEVGVGAGVAEDIDVGGDDPPVGGDAGAIPHGERMPLRPREQGFLAAPHHLHGAARLPHGQRQEGLDGHVLPPAEASSHVGRDHPHSIVRQAEDRRDLGSVLDDLRSHAQRHHPGGVDPADAGLGLQIRMIDRLGPVLRLDHVLCRSHGAVGVA